MWIMKYFDLMLINGDVYYIARKHNSFLIGRMVDDSANREPLYDFHSGYPAIDYNEDVIISDMSEPRTDTMNMVIDVHWFSDGLNLYYGYVIYNSHNSEYTTFVYAYDTQSNKSALLAVIEDFHLSASFGIFDNILIYDGYPGYLELTHVEK